MSLVIHINGWPGSGKLTVARELTALIDGRLIDNHTLMNPARMLFDRRQREFAEMRREIRDLVFAFARKVDASVPLVFTDALADEPFGQQMFDDCRNLAADRRARLVPVVLDLDESENERRLVHAGRAERWKLTDVAVLRELRAQNSLYLADGIATLRVDASMPSAQAAAEIVRASDWGPAR